MRKKFERKKKTLFEILDFKKKLQFLFIAKYKINNNQEAIVYNCIR